MEAKEPAKHTSELALVKCSVTMHPTLEFKYKVMQKYGRKGDNLAKALQRAIEDMTKDVKLSAASLRQMDQEMRANFEKRMAAREARGLKPRRLLKDYSPFAKQ